jgi:ankyrin repeat protein
VLQTLEERVKRFILAISCMFALAAVVGPFLAQTQQGRLASLIQAGNRKAALDMIRAAGAGTDVNEAQPDGTRPIHWAVYRVDYEVLEALIAKKAKADVRNELGATPLAEAVKVGDSRMVKTLLDAGSGPEGANDDNQSALMLAIKNGDLAIVQMLVNAGANVNAVEKVQEQTPLMWAAAATRNAAEMVKVLLAKGAKVNVRAKYVDWPSQITSEPRAQYHAVGGLTPLLYAARGGCYGCVEALVNAGADVNLPTPEGVTPLLIALDNNHNGVAKFLLDHNANPHVWDVYGRTALYTVVDKKAVPVAAAPGGGRGAPGAGAGGRGGGGQAGAGGRGGGAPAPVPVASGPAVSSMEIINALLAAGVDSNAQLSMRRPSNQGGRFSDPLLSTGTTPLLNAVLKNDTEVVRALLDKGANPNIVGMGTTPFLLAAGTNSYGGRGGGAGAVNVNTAILDLMIQRGADVNAQVTGTRTFSMRVSRNLSQTEGMSALHSAVAANNTDLVRYLLERGARTDLVDISGRTPLDVANGVAAKPVPPEVGAAVPTIPIVDPATAAAGGRGGAGARGASAEIKTLLQTAAQNQKK